MPELCEQQQTAVRFKTEAAVTPDQPRIKQCYQKQRTPFDTVFSRIEPDLSNQNTLVALALGGVIAVARAIWR
jgi:hypothetical protein